MFFLIKFFMLFIKEKKKRQMRRNINSLNAPFFDPGGQKSDNLDALFSMELFFSTELLCHENCNVE